MRTPSRCALARWRANDGQMERTTHYFANKRVFAANSDRTNYRNGCGAATNCADCLSSYTYLIGKVRLGHWNSPQNKKGYHNCRWWVWQKWHTLVKRTPPSAVVAGVLQTV